MPTVVGVTACPRSKATARRFSQTLVAIWLSALALGGCTTAGTPILANPPAPRPSAVTPTAPPINAADPRPVVLPRDDGPHDRLTEWWYYTGHLHSRGGSAGPHRFGFEYVIFRAERGTFSTTWASHLAITDETGDRFAYAQRLDIGEGVDRSPRAPGDARGDDPTGDPTGFDLSLSGIDPADPTTFDRPAWTMTGANGTDHLEATLSVVEATAADTPGGLALNLDLTSRKPAALHDRDGWIDFGPAGSSYYYSRTAMDATGTIVLDGTTLEVTGDAWFDHQWGDFISVGGGGWDWFAVNLDDGTDLTLSLVRDADGAYPLVYGTVVDPDGATRHLDRNAFTVTVTDRWISPTTGADYPAGWTISIPSETLGIELTPTVAAQELDTRATTGVIYWEGSQHVSARRGRQHLGGEAYVELTGYAATAPPG